MLNSQFRKNMWNIPNLLSIFRVILIVPLSFALWNEQVLWVVIICITAFLTDALDGIIARKYEQVTEYGKIIDPLADKLFVAATVLILFLQDKLPLWFAVAIWLRDGFIVLGSLFASRRIKHVIPSDYIGKAAVNIISFTLLVVILDLKAIIDYALAASLAAVIVSSVNYIIRAIKIIKKSDKHE